MHIIHLVGQEENILDVIAVEEILQEMYLVDTATVYLHLHALESHIPHIRHVIAVSLLTPTAKVI